TGTSRPRVRRSGGGRRRTSRPAPGRGFPAAGGRSLGRESCSLGFFAIRAPEGCAEATIHTRCFSLPSARNEASLRYGPTQGEPQVVFSHTNGPRRSAGKPNDRSEASARPVAGGVRHLLHRAAAADDGTPGPVTRVLLLREPP